MEIPLSRSSMWTSVYLSCSSRFPARPLLQPVIDVVCLHDQHVHQRRFTMMQMTCKCNVPNLFWKIHQVCHKLPRKVYGWQISLLDHKFLLLYRRNDRLRKRLGIFLLHHRLDVCTIDLLCSGIILLVFVENNRIRGTLIFDTRMLAIFLFLDSPAHHRLPSAVGHLYQSEFPLLPPRPDSRLRH